MVWARRRCGGGSRECGSSGVGRSVAGRAGAASLASARRWTSSSPSARPSASASRSGCSPAPRVPRAGRGAILARPLGALGGALSALGATTTIVAGRPVAGAVGGLVAATVVSGVVAGAAPRAGQRGRSRSLVALAAVVVAGLSILFRLLALIALARPASGLRLARRAPLAAQVRGPANPALRAALSAWPKLVLAYVDSLRTDMLEPRDRRRPGADLREAARARRPGRRLRLQLSRR